MRRRDIIMAKIAQFLYNVLVNTVCGYMYMYNIKKRYIVTTAKKTDNGDQI
jgi:hypothetical protein